MANRFLGIDSINVLKEYIDGTIQNAADDSKLFTLQVYRYVAGDAAPNKPDGGCFDVTGSGITYPAVTDEIANSTLWLSLYNVIRSLCQKEENTGKTEHEVMYSALENGSIWMSVGVAERSNNFSDWSTPIKISGQNGESVKFSFAYDINAAENTRSEFPQGVNEIHPIEYVWVKYGDGAWNGPTEWQKYTTDASDVLYRYCVTATNAAPHKPTSDANSIWTNSIALSVTHDMPYMWMTSKRVKAGVDADDTQWSDPILFGHYGMDGQDGQDGIDGNIPSYSVTLYAKTDIVDGEIVKPEFVYEDKANIDDVKELNAELWSELPVTGDDNSIWWYVVINVNGGDRENPDLAHTINSVSDVMRFSAIDGEQIPGKFTKYQFAWLPTSTTDISTVQWKDYPEVDENSQTGSLWMRMGIFKLNSVTNVEEPYRPVDADENWKEWSDPVKLTGPRGPIAYDYRIDSVYAAGNEYAMKGAPTPTYSNTIDDVALTPEYPYIWETRYLRAYTMKYTGDKDANGNDAVDVDETIAPVIVKSIGSFRLSGVNGATGLDGAPGVNGNKINSIRYSTSAETISINNNTFDEYNYFIANTDSDTTVSYVLHGVDFNLFVSGYTGKFMNIGKGKMVISTDANDKCVIMGSNREVNDITVMPNEVIELISYNDNGNSKYILVGKSIEEIDEAPVMASDTLLSLIADGGEIVLGSDMEMTSPIIIDSQDVTIDLNGHTITAPLFMESGGEVLEGNTDSYVFWVKDGNLTIKGKGKVVAQHADYSMAVWCQGGNVIIEDGEYRNGGESCSLIYASGTGNIVIKGGKFIATPKGTQGGTGDEYTALNLKDKDNMTCSITVEGGHYYGFDPANNSAEDNADWWAAHPNGFVAENCVSVKNGAYYSVI